VGGKLMPYDEERAQWLRQARGYVAALPPK
jgi:hypothetical protein